MKTLLNMYFKLEDNYKNFLIKINLKIKYFNNNYKNIYIFIYNNF